MQMEAVRMKRTPEFYVWDHVAVALHVDKQVPPLFSLFPDTLDFSFHILEIKCRVPMGSAGSGSDT